MLFINSFAVAVPATIILITLAAFARTRSRSLIKDATSVRDNRRGDGGSGAGRAAAHAGHARPRGINISGQYVSVWLLHAGFRHAAQVHPSQLHGRRRRRSIIESAKVDYTSHDVWKLVFLDVDARHRGIRHPAVPVVRETTC